MSFSDLERGLGPPAPTSTQSDPEFDTVTNDISLQIFKINGNVAGLNKLVDLLGSPRDTPGLRKQLHDLTEVTKDLIKRSTEDVKRLASIPISERRRKLEQAKLSRDFQTAVMSFQRAQKQSAAKQRQYVDRAKAIIHEEQAASPPPRSKDDDSVELEEQRPQLQQLVQTDLVQDDELEYQEQLIEEREGDIREIETGIAELNDIFRDLGTIVHEQQSMLDNIESNVNNIANDTDRAAEELVTAHKYQKRAGRRMFCLLLIFIVVLAIVLLAILV